MKKRAYTFRDIQTIAALVALSIILTAGLVTFNWWFARQFGTGAEFLPVWNGARDGWRALLFQPVDPYGQAVTLQTQLAVYGRGAQAGEYPYALDIPFPLLMLYFPLALIPDPVWARAVWMFLSEIGLILLVLLATRLTDWMPKAWFQFVLFVFALASFYSVTALQSGSFSIVLVLVLVGALVFLREFEDEVAGMLLALAAVKWEQTLLLWLFIVVGVYVARRWRVFAGIAMVWIVLGGLSFLLYPGWVWPYLRAVVANLSAGENLTPVRFLVVWFPAYGMLIGRGLTVFLALLLVFEWVGSFRSASFTRVAWTAALTLAVTPLIGLPTTMSSLAPLVFSFAVILPFAWERWEKRPYLVLIIFCLVFFAYPYLLHWQWPTQFFLVEALTYLLLPVLLILGLYWVRWYVVRPPRTWADAVRRELRK